MTIKTFAKKSVNRVLRHLNARLDSTTVEKIEGERLRQAVESGHFAHEVFPLPDSFRSMQCSSILEQVALHAERFNDFDLASADTTDFSFANGYFTSPDAEVLYAIIHQCRPSTLIEVGSGNSTRMAKRAIMDVGCETRLISIDPEPRTDIGTIVDVQIRTPVDVGSPKYVALFL